VWVKPISQYCRKYSCQSTPGGKWQPEQVGRVLANAITTLICGEKCLSINRFVADAALPFFIMYSMRHMNGIMSKIPGYKSNEISTKMFPIALMSYFPLE